VKVGKYILGLQALEVVASHAKNVQETKLFLVSIAMAQIRQQEAELGVPCGSTYRARFVEDMVFAGAPHMDGFLIEFKVGPNPPVDDLQQYTFLHYFGEVNREKVLVQFYKIDNFPETGDDE
jgi:hypothetical protein